MNIADGQHAIPEPPADGDDFAVPAAARHHPRAASPLLSPWSHCLASPPAPAAQVDPAWRQYLSAGIDAG